MRPEIKYVLIEGGMSDPKDHALKDFPKPVELLREAPKIKSAAG